MHFLIRATPRHPCLSSSVYVLLAHHSYEKRGDSGDLAVWRGTFWLSGIKEACKCLGYPILTKRANDYEEGKPRHSNEDNIF